MVLLAAAFGAVNGALAAALLHFLPIAGDIAFVTFGEVPVSEPLQTSRPTWWPSIAVLPLALGGFSAALGASAYSLSPRAGRG